MAHTIIDTQQGHWLLSRMGKKVLRPGGKELTLKLLNGLEISHDDRVVEFAPGIGYTAEKIIAQRPKSYTGIEMNEEAADLLRKKIKGDRYRILTENAAHTSLAANEFDVVIGEAMLTMQADHRKAEIIREAHRLLEKGGIYGIHELGLTPDDLEASQKAKIQKELSLCIKVNARPLTQTEWIELLEKEGFKVLKVFTNTMSLLDTSRIIDDEGLFHSLKIGFNIIRHPKARRRINEMRCVFNRYKKDMNAVAIIAQKV